LGEVPPPARGWPLTERPCVCGCIGSPARAGMAPAEAGGIGRGTWFPRPRGDGPSARMSRRCCWRVPPPARGWPLCRSFPLRVRPGSPARAGMAPSPIPPSCVPAGFPRPRGDGPLKQHAVYNEGEVPPPARGWPRRLHLGHRRADGSPARAGMAPLWTSTPARSARFARPRGDGPLTAQCVAMLERVPPPARGWPESI
jgi:hypothetical protein